MEFLNIKFLAKHVKDGNSYYLILYTNYHINRRILMSHYYTTLTINLRI